MAYPQQMTPQCQTTTPFFSPGMAGGDNYTVPLELLYGLDEYAYQELDLSAMMASGGGGLVGSPTTPPTTPPMDVMQDNGVKNASHRRTQNRAAQRRFRERKEQREQTLQQKVDDLRVMCQALSEEQVKNANELARLQQENDALRDEVKGLHRQWRLTQTILQWSQQSSQSQQQPQPPLGAGGDAGFMATPHTAVGGT